MKVLIPFQVTEATLTDINIPEDDYAEWSGATTYARGALVISTATHSVYRSLTPDNTGNDPDLEMAALADPLIENPDPQNWQMISATNPWRLFDQKPSRIATNPGSIQVELTPNEFIGGVAGFEILASEARVEVYSGAEKLYDKTVEMQDNSAIIDWLAYFTEPITPLTEFVLTDLPVLGTPRIVVTLSRSVGDVQAGQIVFGQLTEMGQTKQDGTGFSGLDFSYVQVDDYGDLETVQRPATRVFDFSVSVDRSRLFALVQSFKRLRGGVPAVWIASDRTDFAAIGYGFYRGYREVYVGADYAEIAIEVQGVV